MDTAKHPESAYRFRAKAPKIDQAQGGTPRKFKGVAYSGRALSHPYWGTVIFDLATTEAPNPTPILVNHDRDKRAGFATLKIGADISIEDGTLMDNSQGQAVAAESDAGFPWQMSVHIQPDSIEELKPGATTTVNGHEITGPAAIFRNNMIREVSFTPTGVDHNTSATAMSAVAARHRAQANQAEDNTMELEELKQQIAELKASLEQAQAEAKAATERAESAEGALEAARREQRMSAVKALFSDLGREFSDEAAKPYMGMSDETFAAVASDMRAAKPKAPENLFHAEATDGEPQQGNADMLINA